MESFIIVVILAALAALSNWLQQRAHSQPPPSPPDGNRPPVPRLQTGPRPRAPGPMPGPRPETTLERELRRLLGEELPAPPRPSPSPMQAPPLTVTPVAPPPLAPVAAGPRSVPPPASRPAPLLAQSVGHQFDRARAALHRARQIHQSVTLRPGAVDTQTVTHGSGRRVLGRSPASAAEVMHELRGNRQAVRRAFVGSLIFGTPKGMEP